MRQMDGYSLGRAHDEVQEKEQEENWGEQGLMHEQDQHAHQSDGAGQGHGNEAHGEGNIRRYMKEKKGEENEKEEERK